MKNKSNVWYSLAMVLAVMMYVPVRAGQKNGAQRADFSGEWRAKTSIAMGGNIVCCFDPGDRLLAQTMKIAAAEGGLTVAVSSGFPGTAPAAGMEKMSFDSKASEIAHGRGRGKKFTVKWSADGRTLTVNSTVRMIIDQKPTEVYVTEVWNLSPNGKSITVQANARSGLYSKARAWKTVFEKVG
ncbi:hypothetical protein FHW88_004961 [Mucilaginibacter sp. SG538B]|uniref:hypothetical protein n=1 Tax=Mucilaginibacter sp. SG538B TaxID=2587021 RepID=UPI00159E3273|nr:hypothetical protein [Mucilaginibacter sp. SG538B]NVM66643.1 hypothetical protein [Mucilaginibacter sp. SG538B]